MCYWPPWFSYSLWLQPFHLSSKDSHPELVVYRPDGLCATQPNTSKQSNSIRMTQNKTTSMLSLPSTNMHEKRLHRTKQQYKSTKNKRYCPYGTEIICSPLMAAGYASHHIWCLSQARINWEDCGRKGIWHKNGEVKVKEVGHWLVWIEWSDAQPDCRYWVCLPLMPSLAPWSPEEDFFWHWLTQVVPEKGL